METCPRYGRTAMPVLLQRPAAQPARQSGLDDLLLAGEKLRSSRLFKQAKEAPQKQEDVLLALKRRMLVEPAVVHALDLMKSGLEKPAAPAPAAAGAEAPSVAFPLLHDLAALLEMQQYVYLSLGRVGDGLETARRCV